MGTGYSIFCRPNHSNSGNFCRPDDELDIRERTHHRLGSHEMTAESFPTYGEFVAEPLPLHDAGTPLPTMDASANGSSNVSVVPAAAISEIYPSVDIATSTKLVTAEDSNIDGGAAHRRISSLTTSKDVDQLVHQIEKNYSLTLTSPTSLARGEEEIDDSTHEPNQVETENEMSASASPPLSVVNITQKKEKPRMVLRANSGFEWDDSDMSDLENEYAEQLEALCRTSGSSPGAAAAANGSSGQLLPESALFRVGSQIKWTDEAMDDQRNQMKKELMHLAQTQMQG